MLAASWTRSSAWRSVCETLVRLGPGRDDQPRLARGQVRPDLLAHVGHHRMEQLQEPLERGERRGTRVLVAAVEPRLDRLCVPVAEVVEREVVERARRRRELELRDRRSRARPGPRRCGRGSNAPRDRAAAPRAASSPALARISRATFQSLFASFAPSSIAPCGEAHVLGRGHLEQPVAGRVGAVLGDQVRRVDAGAEALRHAPPVRREDHRVVVDVVERRLAHQLEAGPDHPRDPEEVDVAARSSRRRRGRTSRGRASAPASRASRTARAPRRTTCRARPPPGSARSCRTRRTPPARSRRPSCARRGSTRPGSGAPTRAGARCTRAGCSRGTRA